MLAKNYKAKGYGVSTGEAIWQAKQKCPGLVVVPPHYEEYMKFSKAAREIYEHYTDQVEPFGMDECWLDVTGSTRIMGNGEKIANEIAYFGNGLFSVWLHSDATLSDEFSVFFKNGSP